MGASPHLDEAGDRLGHPRRSPAKGNDPGRAFHGDHASTAPSPSGAESPFYVAGIMHDPSLSSGRRECTVRARDAESIRIGVSPTPLVAPLTLIAHHARRLHAASLRAQTFLT